LWLKTLYRKRAVTWPFIFYTIIWTLSKSHNGMYLIIEKWINLYEYQLKRSAPNKKLPAKTDWKFIFF
ncbi:hypothetical protein, partial [Enterococcus faecium]|uniref:hypothetical protein n=1 Tax=Enterococcus faecium TaxID=1352 RepID=UPI0019D6BD30